MERKNTNSEGWTKIPQENIKRVLDIYNPDYHFLKTAEFKDSITKGVFRINPDCPYLAKGIQRFNHVTDLESNACFSQLAFTSISEAISRKKIAELSDLNFSEIQKDGIILGNVAKKFRKPINPYNAFSGEIELIKVDTTPNNICLFYKGNFENSSLIIPEYLIVIKRKGVK